MVKVKLEKEKPELTLRDVSKDLGKMYLVDNLVDESKSIAIMGFGEILFIRNNDTSFNKNKFTGCHLDYPVIKEITEIEVK